MVDSLVREPLHAIQEAKSAAGVPADSGFYAWWVTPDALPDVPVTAHPLEPYGLLYVGIAPRNATSAATLRSRLCRQHIGGNVASSTFRFGLAALLWRREGWTPRRSASGEYRLDAHDNAALSQWQREYLRVRWAVAETPWLLEAQVVDFAEATDEPRAQQWPPLLLEDGPRPRGVSCGRRTAVEVPDEPSATPGFAQRKPAPRPPHAGS